jgi:hypothetical protein
VRIVLVLSTGLSLIACSSHHAAAPRLLPDAGDENEPIARSAIRCGECHAKIREDWLSSGHAQAATSPLFVALRKTDATCDRCHQPLIGKMDAQMPVVKEGVTCDVCHTIPDVQLTEASATFALDLGANTKYGPLCDATGHYFHRSHCTNLFKSSTYCAACHKDANANKLATFTEYDEWKDAKVGEECQDCHMPTDLSSVAVGFHERAVPHHGFLGHANELRAKGVTGDVSIDAVDGAKVHVSVVLHNEAGHDTPAGMPGRQLVLDVKLLEGTKLVGGDERVYARTLVDAAGGEVPFASAVSEKADTRLKVDEKRTETFDLPIHDAAPADLSVDVTVAWRPLSPTLARAVSLPSGQMDDQVLIRAAVPLAKLPATARLAIPD